MARHIHIIGGGLAGLSAATSIAGRGMRITVYEAGPIFGGRARSFVDNKLNCLIDNGNHLFLSSNRSVFNYLERLGAQDKVAGPEKPLFPFVDLLYPARWTLNLSGGIVPLWPFIRGRRVPAMKIRHLAALIRCMVARPNATVAECLPKGELTRRLFEPLTIAVLNTLPHQASAQLLGKVIRESLMKGGHACLPRYAKISLADSFVEPALQFLKFTHAELRTHSRVNSIEIVNQRITSFKAGEETIRLASHDAVVMAIPAHTARGILTRILPYCYIPDEFESILNLHFRLSTMPRLLGSIGKTGFVGIIGGLSEWVFIRNDVISVTVSAANRRLETDQDKLVNRIWSEILYALECSVVHPLPQLPPPVRIIKEKRATFLATPQQIKKRPLSATGLVNMALAGDWTATGLPATLEGAIGSGRTAVQTLGLLQ